jgi:hypothetical protein
MKPIWLNNGKRNEDGERVAVIESSTGKPVSIFKGRTYREVADRILESQAHANQVISKLHSKCSPRSNDADLLAQR